MITRSIDCAREHFLKFSFEPILGRYWSELEWLDEVLIFACRDLVCNEKFSILYLRRSQYNLL